MSLLLFWTITIYGENLENTIGESSVLLAQEILDKLDRHMNNRVEYFLLFANDYLLQLIIKSYNYEFENISNVQEYITEIDQGWLSHDENTTEFVNALLENGLSQELHSRVQFLKNLYNHTAIGEIFVTNKYGAIIALSNRTSDYYQADEGWWQEAKENGIYISKINYDESSNTTSIDVGVRVEDSNKEFLGVIKANIAIEEVKTILQEFEPKGIFEKYKSMDIKLINENGSLIYAYEFQEKEETEVNETADDLIEYFETLDKINGFVILPGDSPGESDELFAFDQSEGYRYFTGQHWILTIEFIEDEILEPVNNLKNSILIFFIIIIIIIISISLLLSLFISRPIIDLKKASNNVMKGDYNTKVNIKSKDEVGSLADTFNEMVQNLKVFTDTINETNKKLTLLNEKLEYKVKERTQEIEKLLKQKHELITQLGHDLKTPLGPILTLLPIALKKVDNPEIKEMLVVITRNVEYMKTLVLKTMKLIELNSPETPLNISTIDMNEIINTIIENNESNLSSHNLSITKDYDRALPIEADKQKIIDLMEHLVSNAIKYSPNGGSIRLHVEDNKQEITVSIKDPGIGLSKEHLDQIFNEFYKADWARHDLDSSGLGMSIAKIIIQKHGGKIWVESPGIGKGTTVTFTIPKKQKHKK
jgi:signal transduction histidine kinase